MGCRTEPAAVHIAHVLQRLHFLQFFSFFYNLHDLPQKKITLLYRKNKKNSNFFYDSHNLQQTKNYTTRRFFCTRLTFFTIFFDIAATNNNQKSRFFRPFLSVFHLIVPMGGWGEGPSQGSGAQPCMHFSLKTSKIEISNSCGMGLHPDLVKYGCSSTHETSVVVARPI